MALAVAPGNLRERTQRPNGVSGSPSVARPTAGTKITFALAIFLGAFLLFQVQPMIAKFLLPWFGGGPGVWTTCMLFFQGCLLAGYAYAHLLSRLSSTRLQVILHVGLLLAALAFLPIMPGSDWKPAADADPTWRILLLLTVCLGLPYFMLASTGPLLQGWFTRLHPGVTPYRFYALSNLGSLLALASYPFLFEPALTHRAQASLWASGFGLFALFCAGCATLLWRNADILVGNCCSWRGKAKERPSIEKVPKAAAQPDEERVPGLAVKAWWFAFPACGSVLLLATTNKLSLDVAAMPFLWMLPLSLYLLTFIICFDRPAWYARKVFTLLLVPLLALLCYTLSRGSNVPLWWQNPVYGATLLAGCMVCHGEVYRLKPSPRHLTTFYLLIAAGGAAGGLFVGLISPILFHSFAEFNWGYWLLAALVAGIHFRERTKVRSWMSWPAMLAGVAVLGAVLLFQASQSKSETVSMTRNFYGVLRVSQKGVNTPFHAYKLNHGSTTHGLQFTDPGLSILATTYYNEPSGIGVALNNFPRQTNRCVGVVGLGTGTLATYGRTGDTFRFYEIDPEVQRLAQTRFTFLRSSQARVEIVPGDARLSLERESSPQFDLLVLDAFSSDAIPVHLLTQEAFATYFQHLKSDGVIAVHISNRHLDLLRPLVGVAKQFQLMLINIQWDQKDRPWWFSTSNWVLLSHNQSFMLSEPVMSRATLMPVEVGSNPLVWTDDYASLFSILR